LAFLWLPVAPSDFTMSATARIALALFISSCISYVLCVPAYEGVTQWSTIGNLVPGITTLEAINGQDGLTLEHNVPSYVSILAPRGLPGNATIFKSKSPPLFYIHNNQLWHFHNESTILPVQLRNSTTQARHPLRVVVGDNEPEATRQTRVKGGSWRWQGTMLWYDHGQHSTPLFHSCITRDGPLGLFLYIEGGPPIDGCTPFTLHSFSRAKRAK